MSSYIEFLIQVALYLLILYYSLGLIERSSYLKNNYFDPGYLFLIFVSLTFIPVSFLVLFGYQILEMNQWYNIIDLKLYSKTVLAHSIMILSFSMFYYFFSKFISQNIKWPKKEPMNISIVFIIFLITSLVKWSSVFVGGFSGIAQYASLFIGFVRETAEIILIGLLACRFNSKGKSIIFIVVLSLMFYLLPQLVFPSTEGVTHINRGRIFAAILASTCF